MKGERRKELIKAWKERKPSPGIYALRCAATGEVWVAPSRNLDAQQNGIWFTLRLGTHPNRALQTVWNAEGESAFVYEITERFADEDLTGYLLDTALKKRLRHWRATFGAGLAVG